MSKRTSPLVALFVLMSLCFVYQTAAAQDSYTPASETATAAAPVPVSQFLLQFDLPGTPTSLAMEAPGRVWATLPGIDAIGVISVTAATSQTVTAYITQTYQLTPGSQPYNLTTYGGYVWFTAYAGNWIGRLTPGTGVIDAYPIPQANSGPTGIAVAPDGVVWFAQRNANRLGRLYPVTSTIESFTYTLAAGGLEEVATINPNSIWLTAPNLHRLVNFDPDRNEFINVPTLPYTRPVGLAIEDGDIPWISVQGGNFIGRYAPGTLALWRWTQLPTDSASVSGPQQIALTRGAGPWHLFYANAATQTLGHAAIANDTAVGAIHPLKLGDLCAALDVVTEDNGRGWVSCGSANTVLLWLPPYALDAFLPLVTR